MTLQVISQHHMLILRMWYQSPQSHRTRRLRRHRCWDMGCLVHDSVSHLNTVTNESGTDNSTVTIIFAGSWSTWRTLYHECQRVGGEMKNRKNGTNHIVSGCLLQCMQFGKNPAWKKIFWKNFGNSENFPKFFRNFSEIWKIWFFKMMKIGKVWMWLVYSILVWYHLV